MKFLNDIQALQVSEDVTTEMALMLVNNVVKKRNLGNTYLKSVTLNLPAIFNPITATATPAATTLTYSLVNQTAKTFFAAPLLSNGTPSFRPLTFADISNFYTAVDKAQLNYWTKTGNNLHYPYGSVNTADIIANGSITLNKAVGTENYLTFGVGGIFFQQKIYTANPRFELVESMYGNSLITAYAYGAVRIGNGADTGFAKLQVDGSIQQSVNTAMLKADPNGVLEAAVDGTDYYSPATIAFANYWTKVGVDLRYNLGHVGVGTTNAHEGNFKVGNLNIGSPSTTGTTDANSSFVIGYASSTWAGGELHFGTYNSSPGNYASWIQARTPTDYSVNRNIVLQPNGGNVGIKINNPLEILDVSGTIKAGVSSTDGNVLLYGRYYNGFLTSFGSLRSSGATYMAFGLKPSITVGAGWESSSAATLGKSAIVATGALITMSVVATSTVAVGTAITPINMVRVNTVGVAINMPSVAVYALDVGGIIRSKDTTLPALLFGRTASLNGGIGMLNDTEMSFSVGTSGIGTDKKMVLNSSGYLIINRPTSVGAYHLQVEGSIYSLPLVAGTEAILKTTTLGVISRASAADIASLLGTASNNYIQNQIAVEQAASAWVSGTFKANVIEATLSGSTFGFVRSTRRGYYGTYSSLEIQGIWSISSSYTVDTVANNFGTQYGLVHAHANAGAALPDGVTTKNAISSWGHQILYTLNGVVTSGVSLTLGSTWQLGQAVFGNYTTAAYSATSHSFISPTTYSYLANNLELGKTGTAGLLRFRRSSDGSATGIGSVGFTGAGNLNLTSSETTNGIITFTTVATERGRFTNDGKFLVGTPTPVSGWKVVLDSGASNYDGLYVNGNIKATGNIIADGYFSGTSSDRRYKSEFKAISVIDKIDKLGVFSYQHSLYDRRMIGSIAQEVQELFPELVYQDDKEMFRLYDNGYAAIALQLGKELKSEVDILKDRVKELEQKIAQLSK